MDLSLCWPSKLNNSKVLKCSKKRKRRKENELEATKIWMLDVGEDRNAVGEVKCFCF